MPDRPAPVPPRDWRDEGTYRDLARLDRSGFAWEYLRRNPDYRQEKPPGTKAVARQVDGVRVIDAPAVAPVAWGLRFRRGAGHRHALGQSLLG